jgi:hypothetical protein
MAGVHNEIGTMKSESPSFFFLVKHRLLSISLSKTYIYTYIHNIFIHIVFKHPGAFIYTSLIRNVYSYILHYIHT